MSVDMPRERGLEEHQLSADTIAGDHLSCNRLQRSEPIEDRHNIEKASS